MKRRSFLAELPINHGPRALLSDMFEEADRAIEARGVTLSFGRLEDLAAANRANGKTWLPLFPTFDRAVSNVDETNTLCWIGRNRSDEIVATQAVRFFDWTGTDFNAEAGSLRLMYDDPERSRRPGETCVVTAEGPRAVTGRAVFAGAMWYHPSVRGQGLPNIMSRIARCSAHTVFGTDYTVGMISESVMQTDLGRKSGHANVDWSLHLTNSMYGNVRFAVVWTNADELALDADMFLHQLRRESVDAGRLRQA